MGEGTCQYCGRTTATDICPAHGYVGKGKPAVVPDSIPIGLIAIWSGTVATIPAKWSLCNGSNGTPDLREKFIMGAGTTAPATTGGSNAHTHSVSATGSGAAGVTVDSGGPSDHGTSVTQPTISNHSQHKHLYSGTTGGPSATNTNPRGTAADITYASAAHTHDFGSSYTGYQDVDCYTHSLSGNVGVSVTGSHGHAHTVSGGWSTCSSSGTASSAGVGVAYYALAYIMKVG